MARGAISLSKGTVGATGSGQRKGIISRMATLATAYKVSALDTWVQADFYNSGGFDHRILHSVGSPLLASGAGDADLWIDLEEYSGGIFVRAMSDFCPANNTYLRLVSTSSNQLNCSDTAGYDWWCVVNDYEFIFVFVQSGTTFAAHFGQPINGLSEASKIGGRARLTVATSGTGVVVLSLDRDLTGKLTAGQKIFLLNQTPDGAGSLSNDFCEIVTVDSIGSSTITVSGVANQPYQIGSLVGLYPYNVSHCQSGSNYGSFYLCPIFPNATSGINATAALSTAWTSSAEPNMDPDFANVYRIGRNFVHAGTSLGVYGVSELQFACTTGTQANGDRMLVDGDTNKAYWVFPGLAAGSPFGGGCPCIGPGATV